MAHPALRLFSRRVCQRNGPLFQSTNAAQRTSSLLRAPTRRSYAATGEKGPRPVPGQSPFKVWPFIAITLMGSGAYVLMVRQRAEMAPAIDNKPPQLAAPPKDSPAFSADKVTVIFVLGGPGAGKGTQCANLVRDYGFTHLSAGDLLRAEQEREGSEFGQVIRDCIKDGAIVPMEVTVQLLENAMREALDKEGRGRFLVDGFPRKMDQAEKFERSVCRAKVVLFFDCPEEEMQKRLLRRGETSGRTDDNEESIKKRFKTFVETSMPVVDAFEKEGRVIKVLATKAPDDVYKDTKLKLENKLGSSF